MRRGARPVRVLVIFALAGVGLVVSASPCLACSCARSTPAEKLEDASAAFVGRVVETTMGDEGTTQTFEVDGVYKGDVGPTVEVWAQIGGSVSSTCAVVFPEGERLGLVLRRSGERWTTSICSLVTETQLTRVAGAPRPPSGQVTPSPSPAAPTVGGVLGSPSEDALPGWSIAILGALVGIAVIWVVLVMANRRERRRAVAEETSDGVVEQAPPANDDGVANADV